MKQGVTCTRVAVVTVCFAALFAAVLAFALATGPGGVDIQGALATLRLGFPGAGDGTATVEQVILYQVRLPRCLFAGIVGSALATAGVLYQGLLRNPLAEPFILGISGGAALGAVAAVTTGLAGLFWVRPVLSLAGALTAMALVFVIGRSGTTLRPTTLLLAGVIVNAFFSALIMFFISISTERQLHDITHWLMGNLGSADMIDLRVLFALLAAGFVLACAQARPLNLLSMGEETAGYLGVNVERVKIILFVTGSLLTALAVAFSGIIGFVGLIIPHMVRLVFGSDHRLLLPSACLFGGAFLVAADTIARSVVPYAELPVGVVTALCGAPFFLYLLKRGESRIS